MVKKMFLVGNFHSTYYMKTYKDVVLKEKITKKDLAETISNSAFQVINLDTLEFFDAGSNSWIPFQRGES